MSFKIKAFFADTFAPRCEKKVKNPVIDIRNSSGGCLLFYLPNSNFEFNISIKGFFSAGENEDSGVKSDIYAERKPENIGNTIDRELETAKKMINQVFHIVLKIDCRR